MSTYDELILDEITLSGWVAGENGIRYERGFLLRGWQVFTDEEEEQGTEAEEAAKIFADICKNPPEHPFPRPGDPLSTFPLARVVGYAYRGYNARDFRGVALYETPPDAGWGTQPRFYYPTIRPSIQQITTELDGDNQPIFVGYDAAKADPTLLQWIAGAQPDKIKSTYVGQVPKTIVTDVLTLSSWGTLGLTVEEEDTKETVNLTPFYGKPKGYWLCLGVYPSMYPQMSGNSYQRQFNKVAVFWGRKRGWDGYIFWHDPNNRTRGALVNPARAKALMEGGALLPGSGEIDGLWQKRINGMTRAINYPYFDHQAVFGEIPFVVGGTDLPPPGGTP